MVGFLQSYRRYDGGPHLVQPRHLPRQAPSFGSFNRRHHLELGEATCPPHWPARQRQDMRPRKMSAISSRGGANARTGHSRLRLTGLVPQAWPHLVGADGVAVVLVATWVYRAVVVSLAWPRSHLDHPHTGYSASSRCRSRNLWGATLQRRDLS